MRCPYCKAKVQPTNILCPSCSEFIPDKPKKFDFSKMKKSISSMKYSRYTPAKSESTTSKAPLKAPIRLILLLGAVIEIIAVFLVFEITPPMTSIGDLLSYLISTVILTAMVYMIYMLPTLIGSRQEDSTLIFWVNLLLGWVIPVWGWMFFESISDIRAERKEKKRREIDNG